MDIDILEANWWLCSPLFRAWLAYFFLLGPQLMLISHSALLPQYEKLFNGGDLHGIAAYAARGGAAFYPMEAGLVALCCQRGVGFMVEAINSRSPLIEFRLSVLAIFSLGFDALKWIDWAIIASAVAAMLIGCAGSLSKENPHLSGLWYGSQIATTACAILQVLFDFMLIHSSKLRQRSEVLVAQLPLKMKLDKAAAPYSAQGSAVYLPLESNDRNLVVGWSVLGATLIVLHIFAIVAIRTWTYILMVAFPAITYGLWRLELNSIVKRTRVFCCPFFFVAMGLYMLAVVIVGVAPALLGQEPSTSMEDMGGPLMYPPPKNTSFNFSYVPRSMSLHFGSYPVCNMAWDGGHGEKPGDWLTVLDFAVFADAIYLGDPNDMRLFIESATRGTNLEGELTMYVQDEASIGRIGVFELPSIRMAVIAIRGSQTADDWLYNFDVWMPSVLYRALTGIMPWGNFIPKDFANAMLDFDLGHLLGVEPIFKPAYRKLQTYMNILEAKGYVPVITGHSLGGGLGQIFAARLGISAMVFSPVGISLIEGRLDIRNLGDLPVENTVTSVIPWGDIVPLLLDEHTSVTQYIQCNVVNPIWCHDLRRSACEIYRKCGDPRGRDLDTYCSAHSEAKWLDIPMPGFFWN